MNIDYEFSAVDGVHFQKEEISQIEKGFAHGLTEEQVLIYAWPDYPEYHAFAKYTDFAMKEIRKALEAGCDAEYVKKCTELPYWDMVKNLEGQRIKAV